MKHDWKKSYRAAILESDPSKLPQRITEVRAAILERSRILADSPAVGRNEQDFITRALHILSVLGADRPKP